MMASRDSIERSSSEFGGAGGPPVEVESYAPTSFASVDDGVAQSSTDQVSTVFDGVLRSDVRPNHYSIRITSWLTSEFRLGLAPYSDD